MLARRLAAEGLGSMLLAATVIGSGVMAQRLAEGNDAIALLANTGATVAVLAVLIALLGPVSGAHFNPAITLISERAAPSRSVGYPLGVRIRLTTASTSGAHRRNGQCPTALQAFGRIS